MDVLNGEDDHAGIISHRELDIYARADAELLRNRVGNRFVFDGGAWSVSRGGRNESDGFGGQTCWRGLLVFVGVGQFAGVVLGVEKATRQQNGGTVMRKRTGQRKDMQDDLIEGFQQTLSFLRVRQKDLNRVLDQVATLARKLLDQELTLRRSLRDPSRHPQANQNFTDAKGLRIEIHEALGLSMLKFEDSLIAIDALSKASKETCGEGTHNG